MSVQTEVCPVCRTVHDKPLCSTGTPADLTRVVNISKVKGSHSTVISKVLDPLGKGLREQGYQWFRVTAPADEEDRVYMEAWRVRPQVEGLLNRAIAEEVQP